MVNVAFNRSASARNTGRSFSSSTSVGSPRFSSPVSAHRKWWVSRPSSETVAVVFLTASIFLVFGCMMYLYVSRYVGQGSMTAAFPGGKEVCDVFDGNWVIDDTYPLYNSTECPFVERGFNCLANGRKDMDYLKWRWKPRQCNTPKFDVRKVLEWLRNKRVVFVGDSMSRTQWESFICMLMTGVHDPANVYELNGNQISKTIRFLGVHFASFNFSVEFFRSPFLVQEGLPPRNGPKRVRSMLRLDKMDDQNRRWVDTDVLIFNSGHWWTPTKLFDRGCYFEFRGLLRLGMPIDAAFRMALETWASWIETSIDVSRTRVFFRTFEPSHWSGSNQKLCELTDQPLSKAKGNDRSEFGEIIGDVIAKMKVHVTVLNVTLMGAFRSDAHIGTWSHPTTFLDCSHWCLPGVPDAWNELVFSYLLSNGWRNLSPRWIESAVQF